MHAIEQEFAIYAANESTPWHGIGIGFEPTGSISEDIKRAIELVPMLNASYGKVPSYSPVGRKEDGSLKWGKHPNLENVIRVNDGKMVNTNAVGARSFSLMQPTELFEWSTDILEGCEDCNLSFAALLHGGNQMVQTYSLGKFEIAGEDYDRFLVTSVGFDGTRSREALISAVRTVCANTLYMARQDVKGASEDDAKMKRRVKNTRYASDRQAEATNDIQRMFARFDKLKERGERLADITLSDEQAAELIVQALTKRGTNVEKTRGRNVATEILRLYKGAGTKLRQWEGTAYGLEQAFTEYDTHLSNVRGARSGGRTGKSDTEKLLVYEATTFGTGNRKRETTAKVFDSLISSAPMQQAPKEDKLDSILSQVNI